MKLSKILFLITLFFSSQAYSLNKQQVNLKPLESYLDGFVFGGVLFYNPSYTARPDNTGKAFLRYGAHFELDLYKKHIILTYDGNLFSDYRSQAKIQPSEFDHIAGLLIKLDNLEFSSHFETDRSVDIKGMTQDYIDLCIRYYYNFSFLSGYSTFGALVYNPSFTARPDNTGYGLFKLINHINLKLYKEWIALGIELNLLTNRDNHSIPSELDTTIDLVFHLHKQYDFSIITENDRPVDNRGFEQTYVSAILFYRFF